MSEFAANPADVQEQEQDLDLDRTGLEETAETEEPVEVPEDANEADVLEQTAEVPEDDEDYRE